VRGGLLGDGVHIQRAPDLMPGLGQSCGADLIGGAVAGIRERGLDDRVHVGRPGGVAVPGRRR
jgi:hypothetical protein